MAFAVICKLQLVLPSIVVILFLGIKNPRQSPRIQTRQSAGRGYRLVNNAFISFAITVYLASFPPLCNLDIIPRIQLLPVYIFNSTPYTRNISSCVLAWRNYRC